MNLYTYSSPENKPGVQLWPNTSQLWSWIGSLKEELKMDLIMDCHDLAVEQLIKSVTLDYYCCYCLLNGSPLADAEAAASLL